MSDLKPCPFCGSEAKEQNIIIVGHGLCKMVFCEKCHIDFKNPTAIDHWNTRPAEDAKDKEIERLKAALHSVLQNAESWDNEDDSLAIIHRIATNAIGKDTDVPANAPDTGKMEG